MTTVPDAMTQFSARIHSSPEDLAGLRPAWNALRERFGVADVETHPDWLFTEVRARPGSRPAAIGLYQGENLVGLAPLCLRSWNWDARFAYRTLARFPAQLAEVCGARPLCPDIPEAYEAMFGPETRRELGYDLVLFESVEVGSGLHRWLSSPSRDAGVPFMMGAPQPHWKLRLGENMDAYMSSLKSDRRYTLKRRAKKMDAAAGAPVRVERISSPSQVPDFVAHVARVSALSWQGTRLGITFPDTEDTRAKWMAYAEANWLRSYLLFVGDQCVAFEIASQERDVFYKMHGGYDPAWAHLAPGTVLFYRVIEDLHEHRRPVWLDFGTGENDYKRLYGTDAVDTVDAFLVRPSPYMSMARWVHRAVASTEDLVRVAVKRSPIRTQLMDWLRGRPARTAVATGNDQSHGSAHPD